MPDRVFVSHAASDSELVRELVEQLIVLGSGVPEADVFFSSGAATRVPAGRDFREYIRAELDGARIVVAIITPQFMASAFCLAEVGAAWANVREFVPLAVPTFNREALRGVLPGLQVNLMTDPGALDELNDRVCEAMGSTKLARAWGPRKAVFESQLSDLVGRLTPAATVAIEELEAAREDMAAAQEALLQEVQRRREIQARLDAVLAADDISERQRLALPSDERERFDALLVEAKSKVAELSSAVALTIWAEIAHGELEIPSRYDDPYLLDRIEADINRGHLVRQDGSVVANEEYPDIAEAKEAVRELYTFLRSAAPAFEEWFKAEFRKPPRLSHKEVWDDLIGHG